MKTRVDIRIYEESDDVFESNTVFDVRFTTDNLAKALERAMKYLEIRQNQLWSDEDEESRRNASQIPFNYGGTE